MPRGTPESLTPQSGGASAGGSVALTRSLSVLQPTRGRVSSFLRWAAQPVSPVKQLLTHNLKCGHFLNEQTHFLSKCQAPYFVCKTHNLTSFFLKKIIYFWREGKGGRKRERNIHVWLPLTSRPLWGTWPTTQACALTGNRTRDPVVCRPALSPLNHSSQGLASSLIE
ncbi:hypothetical protein HJG60_009585 [Phyllostomus discolor]|uniref:Uncharacterized protein n=1 Tax=Phyllostomus discolor TaxID=89673 RepID=A0A834DAM1_9CHIR|nr:hypothetical protein HJG60_009585 [Phyllostomus discolor]